MATAIPLGFGNKYQFYFGSWLGLFFFEETCAGDPRPVQGEPKYPLCSIMLPLHFLSILLGIACCMGGLAIDREGSFYLSDFMGNGSPQNPMGTTVRKVTADGKAEPFTTDVRTPTGLIFGPSGDLYVSNAHPNSIVRVTPEGRSSVFAEQVAWPSAILFDERGHLFTPNCTNASRSANGHSIYEVDPEGQVSLYLTSELLQCGVGLVFDDDHNMYVSNWIDRRILKVTPDRQISVIATIPGQPGEAIANMVYVDGELYVAGFGSNRVWQVTLAGNVSVLAGSGKPGRDDGEASKASFNQPNGIAVADDALYILDVGGGSAAIRRIHL